MHLLRLLESAGALFTPDIGLAANVSLAVFGLAIGRPLVRCFGALLLVFLVLELLLGQATGLDLPLGVASSVSVLVLAFWFAEVWVVLYLMLAMVELANDGLQLVGVLTYLEWVTVHNSCEWFETGVFACGLLPEAGRLARRTFARTLTTRVTPR